MLKSIRAQIFAAIPAAVAALVIITATVLLLAQPAQIQQEKTKTERLLGESLNEFALDENGWTHLHWAAAAGDVESARRLLKMGANPNVSDNNDKSDFSIKGKQRFKLLGQEREQWTNIGITPINVAVIFNSHVVASILLVNGANGANGALHSATAQNATETAALLLKHGVEVNTEWILGMTPLHVAGRVNATETAALLLENGAEVNAKDDKGRTPLHYAGAETAALLLENGAEVNAKDNEGGTPLHHVAWGNEAKTAALLLENGAEVNAKDDEGRTSLDNAITADWSDTGHTEMQSLLKHHGGRCNKRC